VKGFESEGKQPMDDEMEKGGVGAGMQWESVVAKAVS